MYPIAVFGDCFPGAAFFEVISMNIMKRVRKKICPLIIAVFVFFGSVVSVYPTQAAAVEGALTAGQIAEYVLTITGAVNMLSGGKVGKLGGSVVTALTNKVSELLGNGIYQDGNGDLIFSGAATQELYEAMDSNSSYDARAISNFGGVNPASSLLYGSTPYTNAAFKAHLIPSVEFSDSSGFDDYLYYCWQAKRTSDNAIYTVAMIVDVSDCAFIVPTAYNNYLGYFTFYNKSGSSYSPSVKVYRQIYSSNNFQNVENNNGSLSGGQLYFRTDYTTNFGAWQPELNQSFLNYYLTENDFSASFGSSSNLLDFMYNNFPYSGVDGGCLLYCNKSLIFAKTTASGNAMADQSSGVIYSNNYNIIPSVSKDVLINNDWNSIYNSYVTNVNNNQQYFYDDTTGTWDTSELRKYMKQYSDNIVNAVNDGVENIADAVNYTNEWLSKIYERLGQILDKLDIIGTDDPSGGDGGGSSGSDVDLSDIEDALNSIDYNVEGMAPELHQLLTYVIALDGKMSTNLTDNARIYALMGQILTAIQSIKLGPTNVTINPRTPDGPDPFADWDDYFTDLDDSDLEDIISPWDTLYELLKGSAPLCYVLFLDELVTSLDVTPAEPIFTIPVKLQNAYIDIDEEIEVDLTIFDSIIPMIKGFILIVFTISLIWASWQIIPLFGALFDV